MFHVGMIDNAPWQPQEHTPDDPNPFYGDGYPGGDDEVAEAHSVRLVQREPRGWGSFHSYTDANGELRSVPAGPATAIITSYWYAAADPRQLLDWRSGDASEPQYHVVNQIEYLICGDNPGGAELWCDYDYSTCGEAWYDTVRSANTAAKRLAKAEYKRRYVNHTWDGLAPFER